MIKLFVFLALLGSAAALTLGWIGLRCRAGQKALLRRLHEQTGSGRARRPDAAPRPAVQPDPGHGDLRSRIVHAPDSGLGSRIRALRAELSQLDDSGSPALAQRIDGTLAQVGDALQAARPVAAGPHPDRARQAGPDLGLRRALEHCLQDHAQLYGLRYRFDAGYDPDCPRTHGRAGRLAVFRLLQEVLAGAERAPQRELHVRLAEGARQLTLDVDGAGPFTLQQASTDLRQRIEALGATLEPGAAGSARLTLTVPMREVAGVG